MYYTEVFYKTAVYDVLKVLINFQILLLAVQNGFREDAML